MDKKKIIVIDIASGVEKPYFYVHKGMIPEAVYIRIGTSKQQVEQVWINEKLASRNKVTLYNTNTLNQNLTFRDLELYYEKLKGISTSDSLLLNLRLINENGFNRVSFLFSDQLNYEMRMPIFDKNNNLVSSKEVSNLNILNTFYKVEEFIKDYYYSEFINPKTARREEKHRINIKVLREVLVNAFIHSDYIKNERFPLYCL